MSFIYCRLKNLKRNATFHMSFILILDVKHIVNTMESSVQDADLPEGWMMCHSKSLKGKVYYFNTLTGESLWEHPEAILHQDQVILFMLMVKIMSYIYVVLYKVSTSALYSCVVLCWNALVFRYGIS